ncbi:MAG TPA: hypothetical protein VFX03_03465, partial [Thermomicrobiales bacterium]|nr:hypothetical protein [Thermomicrobiales bacterium]
RTQRRIRQQGRSQAAPVSTWMQPSAAPAAAPNRLDAPLELQRWEVQLHEVARETTAKIDNKISLLEHLIRDADERIARLQEVGEWLDRSAKLDVEPSAERAIVLSKLSAGDRGRSMSTSSDRAAETAYERPAKSGPISRFSGEIYALADAGHTSAEIAGRLNSPIGEVELILGLRRQRS